MSRIYLANGVPTDRAVAAVTFVRGVPEEEEEEEEDGDDKHEGEEEEEDDEDEGEGYSE